MPRLNAGSNHLVSFTLNGRAVRVEGETRLLASDALRHSLGLTGTHVGCEHGVCGACTIQIDGAPARACLTLAVQLEGRDVRTVESLAPSSERLNTLQEAFRRHHALQCGFCTAGILMSAEALLKMNPQPDEREIREVVGGHICRCTGYTPIIAAIKEAASTMREEGEHV
jgi:2-furoyl-CoA dehydrogenase 2Fe-2S iron sulfur subunit